MRNQNFFGRLGLKAYIALTVCMALLWNVQTMNAQNDAIQVKGVVNEALGPVIGASVVEKGKTTNGTITDIDGNFILTVPRNATLVISYIGYQTQEIPVGGKTFLNVTLKEDAEILEEVVVVGFGKQKKVNVTGSVGMTTSKELESRPVSNAGQLLEGLVPGLQITQNSGTLDSTPSINVRGTGTIGSGSSGSPLVLIDGMEGDLNTVNPQDIESVSVLKDAAASSIYGSRAPFGVIMVTTKSGKAGKMSVNYNNSFRWGTPINKAHTMDSYDFATFFNTGCENTPGWSHHFNDEWLQRIVDYKNGVITDECIADGQYWKESYGGGGHANNDWYDIIYKDTSFTQEHNVSAQGGTEKVNYYLSFNYLDQGGFMNWGNEGNKRYTVSAKMNAELTDWAKVQFSTRWTRTDFVRPSALTDGLYQNIGRQGWPTLPLYDPNGYIYSAPSPVLTLRDGGDDRSQKDNNYHQLALILEPVKNWVTHVEVNYHVQSNTRHWDVQTTYNHDVDGNPYVYGNNNSEVYEEYYKDNFLNFNAYTEYTHNWADAHNFHAMFGFQSEELKQKGFSAKRKGIMIPDLPEIDLTTGLSQSGEEVTPEVGGYRNEWATAGFFGRVNYDYEGRYLLEANLRYDGTSRFRSDNRWVWLPSVSVGWNIARENFWTNVVSEDVVNNLKFRASYGLLGNQNTDNWYQTYRAMSISTGSGSWLQNGVKTNTAGFPALVSTTLTWEKIHTLNIGLDWGLFRNRLTGSFDYFIRDTKNMVGPAQELPATLGTSVPKTNNCDLRTKGWELEISWRDRIESIGLGYGVKAMLSDSRTKITSYPNNPTGSLDTYNEGRYINEIWGYKTIGIAQSEEEMQAHLVTANQDALGNNWGAGDIMYADVNNDGKINSGANTIGDHGDLVKLGEHTPRYHFSLDLTADWKGFDFRAFFQGVLKRDYWQGSEYFFGLTSNFWWSSGLTHHSDYWTPENTDAYYPRPVFSDKNHYCQSQYLQNAAYVRLKNLQLGYTIPKRITQKVGIQNLRVYFSGENLFTITSLRDCFDPETIDGGYGGCVYPLSRTYSCGLSVTF